MVELLTPLLTNIEGLVVVLGYGGIALAMLVVAPELVLPFAGFLVAQDRLTMAGVILASTSGVMLGQVGMYALALWVGEDRMRRFLRRYGRWLLMREQDLDRALTLFERYDNRWMVAGRFIPSIRGLVSLAAGIEATPFSRFMVMTTTGTLIWNALLVYVGALLGRHWTLLLEFLILYGQIVWILSLASVVFLIIRQFRPATH